MEGFFTRRCGVAEEVFFHTKAQRQWWTIPFSERILAEIRQMATSLGYRLLYEEEAGTEAGIKKVSHQDIPNYREVPEEYILEIKELRYNDNTLKIYRSMFEEFINYHFRMDTDKITEPQIIEFLRYLVTERKVSATYQNQANNAIKFYYEKILKGQRKFYFIDRDRMQIRVVQSKGRKDRYTKLSNRLLEIMDQYVAEYSSGGILV